MDSICEACQAPMDEIKCCTPQPHAAEDCNFTCPACGEKAEDMGPCTKEMRIRLNIKGNVELNNYNSQPEIPPSIAQSIGTIILAYALAENNLSPNHRRDKSSGVLKW